MSRWYQSKNYNNTALVGKYLHLIQCYDFFCIYPPSSNLLFRKHLTEIIFKVFDVAENSIKHEGFQTESKEYSMTFSYQLRFIEYQKSSSINLLILFFLCTVTHSKVSFTFRFLNTHTYNLSVIWGCQEVVLSNRFMGYTENI